MNKPSVEEMLKKLPMEDMDEEVADRRDERMDHRWKRQGYVD